MRGTSSPAVAYPIRQQLANLRCLVALAPRAGEPGLELDLYVEQRHRLDVQPRLLEQPAPLVLRIATDVRRIAQLLGLLAGLVPVAKICDEDESPGDTRHLAHGRCNVLEMVRRDARGDRVEAAVGERQVLCASDHVGLHPRRRIDGDDAKACLSQPPGEVSTPCRDIERRLALRPLDEQVEVRPLTMSIALAVRLSMGAPAIGHFVSSTALRAASSIVGSTWRFGGAASASSRLPSSAFVPSSRTTIGRSMSIWRAPAGSRAPPRRNA